jgi:hypothetical protein
MPSTLLLIQLIIVIVADLALASGFVLRWPEYIYDKTKDLWRFWYGFESLGITKSERNCVRIIKFFCLVGILSQTVGIFLEFPRPS